MFKSLYEKIELNLALYTYLNGDSRNLCDEFKDVLLERYQAKIEGKILSRLSSWFMQKNEVYEWLDKIRLREDEFALPRLRLNLACSDKGSTKELNSIVFNKSKDSRAIHRLRAYAKSRGGKLEFIFNYDCSKFIGYWAVTI